MALSPAAFAEDTDVESLLSQGIALREQGKDDQALEVFRRADARAHTPRTGAQVALAEQAIGLWVPAEAHLLAALRAREDPWISRNRAALEGALAVIQKRLGNLEVRADVPGAEVRIDGILAGVLPFEVPLRAEAGRRAVEVRAAGYHPISRVTEIVAGQSSRETFTLVPLPKDDPVGPGRGRDTGPALEPTSGVQRSLGWGLVAGGAAAGAFGGVSLLVREIQVGRYNDRKDCPGVSQPNQPAECASILDGANTWRTLGIVSLVGAGVLLTTGAVLVVTAPGARPRPKAASLSCGPLGLGLACEGRF